MANLLLLRTSAYGVLRTSVPLRLRPRTAVTTDAPAPYVADAAQVITAGYQAAEVRLAGYQKAEVRLS